MKSATKIKQPSYRASIRILFRHPCTDLSYLSDDLNLKPDVLRRASTKLTRRQTNGDAELRKMNVWGHNFKTIGRRDFFSDLEKLVEKLSPHKRAFTRFVGQGGTIEVIIELAGDVNIGDSISWRSLAALSGLKIDLGIEVFPEFGDT